MFDANTTKTLSRNCNWVESQGGAPKRTYWIGKQLEWKYIVEKLWGTTVEKRANGLLAKIGSEHMTATYNYYPSTGCHSLNGANSHKHKRMLDNIVDYNPTNKHNRHHDLLITTILQSKAMASPQSSPLRATTPCPSIDLGDDSATCTPSKIEHSGGEEEDSEAGTVNSPSNNELNEREREEEEEGKRTHARMHAHDSEQCTGSELARHRALEEHRMIMLTKTNRAKEKTAWQTKQEHTTYILNKYIEAIMIEGSIDTETEATVDSYIVTISNSLKPTVVAWISKHRSNLRKLARSAFEQDSDKIARKQALSRIHSIKQLKLELHASHSLLADADKALEKMKSKMQSMETLLKAAVARIEKLESRAARIGKKEPTMSELMKSVENQLEEENTRRDGKLASSKTFLVYRSQYKGDYRALEGRIESCKSMAMRAMQKHEEAAGALVTASTKLDNKLLGVHSAIKAKANKERVEQIESKLDALPSLEQIDMMVEEKITESSKRQAYSVKGVAEGAAQEAMKEYLAEQSAMGIETVHTHCQNEPPAKRCKGNPEEDRATILALLSTIFKEDTAVEHTDNTIKAFKANTYSRGVANKVLTGDKYAAARRNGISDRPIMDITKSIAIIYDSKYHNGHPRRSEDDYRSEGEDYGSTRGSWHGGRNRGRGRGHYQGSNRGGGYGRYH